MVRAGDRIGPYTLVSKLGRGAFGVVWLAEKRSLILTSRVALKLPHDEDIDLDAIRREASVWAQAAGHSNVLPIIDADVYDEQVVIVSEYAPDGSLAAWLNSHDGKAPTVETAVRLIDGVLAGLEHLHSKNIIHRDLKPDNILLQGETPRLADFGIARVLKTTSPYTTMVSGTPQYMAPEAYRGRRTEQTDLWSVGVMLYQLVAGGWPFPHTDAPSLMYAVFSQPPEPLPNTTPAQLQQIITKALEKEPERRYRAAREMRSDIQRFIQQHESGKDIGADAVQVPSTVKNSPQTLAPTVQDDSLLPTGLAASQEETLVHKQQERAVEFIGDDRAYLRWLSENPSGFVINTAKAMPPSYMVLHRAICSHISSLEPEYASGFTERGYVKVCSRELEPLRAWVRQHGRPDRSFSRECNSCNPTHVAQPPKAQEQRRQWDEHSFFEEARKRLNQQELYSLRQLYNFSVEHARVTWGSGTKNGSFNVKFAHINTRSLYTVATDGILTLNFSWLRDNEAGAASALSFGLRLRELRGFNIPSNFIEKYISVPTTQWVNQVDEFIEIVSAITQPASADQQNITEEVKQPFVGNGKEDTAEFGEGEIGTGQSYKPEVIAQIDEPVIAININQQYKHVENAEDLYNCTRGMWRLNRQRADRAHYAFAVYQGVIKEVYRIDKWIPASKETIEYWDKRSSAQGKYFPPEVNEGRSEFIGKLAPEAIREKYIGRQLPERHSQNPIRYFNC